MSIVYLMKRAYRLDSQLEFLVRYFVSRIGFEEMWVSKPRDTVESIQSFYQEHDKDIWRQAYLSDSKYNYKKKILKIYHIIVAEGLSQDAPIIDYGGGAGVLVHYLARKGFTSVDVADIPSQTISFINKMMSKLLRSVFVIDSSFTLQEQEYAAVVCTDVLEHTPNPLEISSHLVRALRPGGVLIIAFPKEVDFSGAHLEAAQRERDAVFAMLKQTCEEVVPMFVYRKKTP
jgi:2-polyprenyl-3-methyl-5-hydroxy-6-metoxy-1,4-benzoquinol methylase